jgi:hypothetical protein
MSDRMKAYARAGVDVDLGNQVKADIPSLVKAANRPEVLGKVGGFGGLFRANFPKMLDPVLVSMTPSARIWSITVSTTSPSSAPSRFSSSITWRPSASIRTVSASSSPA